MCGIVAAASQENIIDILTDGLGRLEYRGITLEKLYKG